MSSIRMGVCVDHDGTGPPLSLVSQTRPGVPWSGSPWEKEDAGRYRFTSLYRSGCGWSPTAVWSVPVSVVHGHYTLDDRWVHEDWMLSCQLSPYFQFPLFCFFVSLSGFYFFWSSKHRRGSWTVRILQTQFPYWNQNKDLFDLIHYICIHESQVNKNWFQFR